MRLPALLLFAATLVAVEVGPVPVVGVADGDTITVTLDGKEERVRLLYVDTPEMSDNAHGRAMEEARSARTDLLVLIRPRPLYLSAPGDALKRDRFGRLLAVVSYDAPEYDAQMKPTGKTVRRSAQEALVSLGHTVYWRKYGDAPEPLHTELLRRQAIAEETQVGAWRTAPEWMREKAGERTAPKAEPARTSEGEE